MKPYFDYPIEPNNIGIKKYQQGVELYDMDNNSAELLVPLSDLFSLPYNVYLLDTQGATLKINEIGANVCGFKSPDQALNQTIFQVSKGNSAQDLLDNCNSVLKQESVKIFDEFNMRHDGRVLQFLSIKFPCYDSLHQLQGILGISIVLGEHPLAEAITKLTDLGLLPKNASPQNQAIKLNLGSVNLTARELECLEYTVKGFTAKEIAIKISISPRTVEEYLNQVKFKMGTSTKQLMIQKVLNT
ncbi:MAG: LuxR C-terminal-related transcriptional regulator [Legionella sp.]|jgi:DNA-binding CsgD family transcriptional regulator